jgi:hypothetical protein
MKRLFLAITLALFSVTNLNVTQVNAASAYEQKKGDDNKKKDPPGPPVVKDKGHDQRPKEPPKKNRRPE